MKKLILLGCVKCEMLTIVQGESKYERSTSRKDTEAYLGITIRLFVRHVFISLGIRLNTFHV